MNRLIKAPLLCGLISIVVLIAIIVGCSDDIVLPELPTLLGEYEGQFWYYTDYGLSTQRRTIYPITWRFSDQNYWLWDAADSGAAYCICEPSGDYTLADGVTIVEREEGCAGCVFDEEKLPRGAFTLRQPNNPNTGQDSIVMTQIIGNVRKDILLIPAGD